MEHSGTKKKAYLNDKIMNLIQLEQKYYSNFYRGLYPYAKGYNVGNKMRMIISVKMGVTCGMNGGEEERV
jgi:hypothetical protein